MVEAATDRMSLSLCPANDANAMLAHAILAMDNAEMCLFCLGGGPGADDDDVEMQCKRLMSLDCVVVTETSVAKELVKQILSLLFKTGKHEDA